MEKEKKRNGSTNAGTCTSVVWAHRGADRKALPPKNIIFKCSIYLYLYLNSAMKFPLRFV